MYVYLEAQFKEINQFWWMFKLKQIIVERTKSRQNIKLLRTLCVRCHLTWPFSLNKNQFNLRKRHVCDILQSEVHILCHVDAMHSIWQEYIRSPMENLKSPSEEISTLLGKHRISNLLIGSTVTLLYYWNNNAPWGREATVVCGLSMCHYCLYWYVNTKQLLSILIC